VRERERETVPNPTNNYFITFNSSKNPKKTNKQKKQLVCLSSRVLSEGLNPEGKCIIVNIYVCKHPLTHQLRHGLMLHLSDLSDLYLLFPLPWTLPAP